MFFLATNYSPLNNKLPLRQAAMKKQIIITLILLIVTAFITVVYFKNLEKTWRATINGYKQTYKGKVFNTLQIRLSNDGFKYTERSVVRQNISTP